MNFNINITNCINDKIVNDKNAKPIVNENHKPKAGTDTKDAIMWSYAQFTFKFSLG